jgi:hypothetical protein
MPIKLDRRTRRDADRHMLPPERFFGEIFPRLNDRHGALVAAGMTKLSAPSLKVEVDGQSWTISHAGDRLALQRRVEGDALTVSLTPQQFSDWAQNEISLNGFLVLRSLNFRDGTILDLSTWDSLWMTLLEGWTVLDDDLSFVDRAGTPLKLDSIFTPQDDPQDIAHFLREAGFLHLRGWLDPADMRAISEDMDRALPSYREGDKKSWWATLDDGSRRCVRLQEFVDHSPTTKRILSSDLWERLREILGGLDRLQRRPVEGRIIEALVKPIGVVSGPSDLSFHRDCHLGRHAYACSRMTIGIAVTSSDVDNGLLKVVAGSHRVAMPVEIAKTRPYLPVIALPTESGDMTVHLSCTLHEATAPTKMERRVLYTEIPLEPLTGGPFDTTVGYIREQVSDILSHEEDNVAG